MAKREKKESVDIATLQPDELTALKKKVLEYVQRMENLDNEIAVLQDDKKELTEEFKDEIDTATLKKVLQILKIEAAVKHKGTFDMMRAALTDRTQ